MVRSRLNTTVNGSSLNRLRTRASPVSFCDHGDNFIVFYDGWHVHFKDLQRATKCFVLRLTDAMRVTRYSRGSYSYNWICECRTHGDWVPLGTTCRMFVRSGAPGRFQSTRISQCPAMLPRELISTSKSLPTSGSLLQFPAPCSLRSDSTRRAR